MQFNLFYIYAHINPFSYYPYIDPTFIYPPSPTNVPHILTVPPSIYPSSYPFFHMAKRMTQDEKRQAMLEIFNKTKSFFKIQELEKIGSKQGIVENTIKDIVISLVDDDLISSDKIGASNFYWGNHNKKRHFKMIECLKLIENKKEIKESILNLKEILRKEIELKPMTEEKKIYLEKLKEKEVNLEKQNEKLKGFTNLTPKEIGELRNRSKGSSKEINELTDNLFVLQNYVCDKFKMEKKDFNETFKVPQDIDYVE